MTQLLAEEMVRADRDELFRWWMTVNELDDINVEQIG